MSRFDLELAESELKIVLQALTDLEQKLSRICETSTDEDEIADISNDLIEVRLLLKPTREEAVSAYGDGILNFSREPL